MIDYKRELRTSLGDFIASVGSSYRKLDASWDDTHIFVLGDDREFTESVNDIWEDLAGDIRIKNKVLMPFQNIACVSYAPEDENPLVATWICDWIREIPVRKIKDLAPQEVMDEELKGIAQAFAIARVYERMPFPITWISGFCGVTPEGNIIGKEDPRFSEDTSVILKQVTAISHPMNYVVRVEPELTPHEARRVAAGKLFPDAKKPHYIVVDHEVLVDLRRQASGGTHSPPVPHERRGHWRRLAERCRKARSQGKDRTWVRPTWVGDEEFYVGRNKYRVMNLKKGVENG